MPGPSEMKVCRCRSFVIDAIIPISYTSVDLLASIAESISLIVHSSELYHQLLLMAALNIISTIKFII